MTKFLEESRQTYRKEVTKWEDDCCKWEASIAIELVKRDSSVVLKLFGTNQPPEALKKKTVDKFCIWCTIERPAYANGSVFNSQQPTSRAIRTMPSKWSHKRDLRPSGTNGRRTTPQRQDKMRDLNVIRLDGANSISSIGTSRGANLVRTRSRYT